jgi:hypothetical protein
MHRVLMIIAFLVLESQENHRFIKVRQELAMLTRYFP